NASWGGRVPRGPVRSGPGGRSHRGGQRRTTATAPGSAAAHVGVAGNEPAPGELVALAGAQPDAGGVARTGRRRRPVVEEEHRTARQVGAVELAGQGERLGQAGRARAEVPLATGL